MAFDRIIFAGIAALMLLPLGAGAQPAPDCRRAATPTDKAICGDPALAAADKKMTAAYAALRANLPAEQRAALLVDQRKWIGQRDGGCRDRAAAELPSCLLAATEERRRFLGGSTPNGVPRVVPNFFHEERKGRYEISIEYPQILDPAGRAAAFNKAMHDAAFGKQSSGDAISEYRSLDPPMATGAENFYEAAYTVPYLDRRLASVLFGIATYSGGAHPNSAQLGILFDLEKGRAFALSDILADPKTSVEAIAAECKLRLEAEAKKEDWELFDNPDVAAVVGQIESWSADKDGVDILFDPYSVAPYVVGPRDCRLSYAELARWLKPAGPLPPHQEEKQ